MLHTNKPTALVGLPVQTARINCVDVSIAVIRQLTVASKQLNGFL